MEDAYGIAVAENEPPLSRNADQLARLRALLPGDPLHWRMIRLLLVENDPRSQDAATWVEVRSGGTLNPGQVAIRPWGGARIIFTTYVALLMTTGVIAAEDQCPAGDSAASGTESNIVLVLLVAALAFLLMLAGFAFCFWAGYAVGRRALLPTADPDDAVPEQEDMPPLEEVPEGIPQQDIPEAVNEVIIPDNEVVMADLPEDEAFFNEATIQRQYDADVREGIPGRIAYARACGACARRKIITGRIIGVARIARRPAFEIGPVWRVRNRYWVVLRDNQGNERVRVFTRWYACFPHVCARWVDQRAIPPTNNQGAEHLDPGAVFHAWSTLHEVNAYINGVGLPAFFNWTGVLEGPLD
jgi:hypothetical protein